MTDNAITVEDAVEQLTTLRDTTTTRLSSRSLDLLAFSDDDEVRRRTWATEQCSVPHIQQSVVTCLNTIKKDSDATDALSSLVIGTENGQVFILDTAGSQILVRVQLPSPPLHFAVSGLLNVEWRIVAACRDGKLYNVKNGDTRNSAVVTANIIDLDALPVALQVIEKSVFAATMAHKVYSFTIRGKKNFSLDMPCAVRDLEGVSVKRNFVVWCLLVGLADGQIRMYHERTLIHTLRIDAPLHALRFGGYGREDNTLAIVHGSGCLSIKMLKRNFQIEPGTGQKVSQRVNHAPDQIRMVTHACTPDLVSSTVACMHV